MRSFLGTLLLGLALLGCKSEDDGLSATDVKKAEDVNAMAKSSDGDWSKLRPEQQRALIQETGSEGTARQVLQMKAHPPAPVAPGKPGAPGP